MLRGKKRPRNGRGKNQGGRGDNRGTKHCEPAKRGKLWCAWGAQCHEKSVRTAAGGKIRREALRKIMAVQLPLKTGRDAEKTVVCPVCKAPRINDRLAIGENTRSEAGQTVTAAWREAGQILVCGQAVV